MCSCVRADMDTRLMNMKSVYLCISGDIFNIYQLRERVLKKMIHTFFNSRQKELQRRIIYIQTPC